jgi:hypothetical protein
MTEMNRKQLIEALNLAAKAAILAGFVTVVYGLVTNDYKQVIPAVVFSFGSAMSVAGYYDRKARRLVP